jgi:hypothetical protein
MKMNYFSFVCQYEDTQIEANFGGYTLQQSQVQQQTKTATELLNTHPHQATTPYALKT